MYDTYVTTISMATYQEWAMSTTIGSKDVNSRTRAGNNGKFII